MSPPVPAPKNLEFYGISTHLYNVWVYARTHQGHALERIALSYQYDYRNSNKWTCEIEIRNVSELSKFWLAKSVSFPNFD